MRNLRIVAHAETALPSGLPLTATAWDPGDDSIVCAFGPTPSQPVIELKRKSPARDDNSAPDLTNVTSWDAPCPLPDLPCDEIILLQYFPDITTSCLVLAGGDVILVREDPLPDQERIEIVGSVDAGISAAAWAPDQELLAIVTRADTLVLMSRDFDPITEASMTPDDLNISKHVSVGWGKKETQFQGKRAKAMRDPTIPETVDEGKPSPFDDGRVSVSWRGDGAYLAVNSTMPGHRRVIRVYNREAVLDSASEPVDGLEGALSWRPSGNLIAGVKRSEDQLEVVFFERNGLRHGQFDLRTKKADMDTWASALSLLWNPDSTVLVVSFRDRVQFWTMGNYHYYLKQEIFISPVAPPSTSSPRWHPEAPLRLSIPASGSLIDLTLQHSICRGSTVPPFDDGIVAVIDGKSLKLTPFKTAGVPPPMSFCEVQFDHNITDCAVSRGGREVAVLTTHTLEFCNWAMRPDTRATNAASKSGPVREQLRHTTSLSKSSVPLPPGSQTLGTPRFTQTIVQKDQEVFILAPARAEMKAQCHLSAWPHDDSGASLSDVSVPSSSQNLLVDTLQNTVWCADRKETRLLSDYTGTASPTRGNEFSFPGAQPNSTIFEVRDHAEDLASSHMGKRYHKLSLTTKGSLYVDDRLLVRDCTSFVFTEHHLIFTTAQHLLKFIHLAEPASMRVPDDTPEVDERCRSIEKGATLVTVIPSHYAVILQMPRGNLETIYPRLLVLSGIRRHLEQLDYRAAFLACQNHQVDMNILHDYDPETFLQEVPRFIEQLKTPSRVDEFLSKLKDEDVTQTLYRDTLKQELAAIESSPSPYTKGMSGPSEKHSTSSSKVNRICDAFLAALPAKSSTHLQNIITAHVCKRPPDLKAGLSLVSSLRQTSAEEVDLAIAHLCFLTDTNRLFDAALALYDLDLALLVAQNAQRDPREYMPFLQSLQDMPLLRRRYKIDDYLRNYAKALTSLHAMGAHDEVETYTVKHNLYTTALALYQYDQTHLVEMTRLYAQHLSAQSQHASAAILFESLQDYTSAYPLYTLAHQWREALTCAALVPVGDEPLRALARTLATTCADESRDYRAAATIYLEYLDDVPGAARLLCRGSYFSDAGRILSRRGLREEMSLILDNGLTERFGEIIELVADCKSQLAGQLPRIKELRKKKEEDPLAFYGGDPTLGNADGVDIPDNVSLAATDTSTLGGQSLFTRYGSNASKFGGTVASNLSRKTSKTKRREERKRARGKKGSVYEEEYLVGSVARLIQRVNGVHDEVKRLINGLLRRGMREQAAKVDEIMQEISRLCSDARKEVWKSDEETMPPADAQQNPNSGDLTGEGERPSGADGVLWDTRMEMLAKKDAPEVKAWVPDKLVWR